MSAPPKTMPMNTLFVGNIPWQTDQDELWKLFSPFGELDSVRIGSFKFSCLILQLLKIRPGQHWDGRPAGYAHIQYVDAKNALSALEADQQEPFYLQNRDLHIQLANFRTVSGFFTCAFPSFRKL
jgi:RNA recognition motif-containing protein